MLVLELQGGLGNQMFLYARARALAEDRQTRLAIDARLYRKHTKRQYELENFTLSATHANIFQILKAKIFGTYLSGEFKSDTYVKNYDDLIRAEFQFKEKEIFEKKFADILQKIRTSNSVAVHVRRGDYVTKQNIYVNLQPDYYQKAMAMISAKVENPIFFFFSDDIEWTKQNVPHTEHAVFICNKSIEDLYLMSQCKHTIIANSTFSWWAAWFNENKDKIIIAPKKWFTTENLTEKELIPSSWIYI